MTKQKLYHSVLLHATGMPIKHADKFMYVDCTTRWCKHSGKDIPTSAKSGYRKLWSGLLLHMQAKVS